MIKGTIKGSGELKENFVSPYPFFDRIFMSKRLQEKDQNPLNRKYRMRGRFFGILFIISSILLFIFATFVIFFTPTQATTISPNEEILLKLVFYSVSLGYLIFGIMAIKQNIPKGFEEAFFEEL